MKLKQIMTLDYHHLPAELLTDILTRLPVKTLLICTSVSKSWYSLITSPLFITAHQLNYRNNPAPLLLLRQEYSFNLKRQCSLHYDIDTFEEFVALDLPDITKETRFIGIACICNGLVCLYDLDKYIVALWNPSLKKSIILPKPRAVRQSGAFYLIGFGIDPISNDYKIVRLTNTYIFLDGVLELLTPLEVELFELSTGTWRNINVGDYPYVISRVNQPALFSDHSYCLWVMKEYGIGSSWTKQFTIDLGQRYMWRPRCCSKNGDILLEKRKWDSFERDLVSYDPKTKLIKNLEIHVPASLHLDTYEYKESLVLPKSLADLWKKENVVACRGTTVLPREDDDVNKKNREGRKNSRT
ncbi:hypothetical protein LguiB_020552 [Lonicera macranthoides]